MNHHKLLDHLAEVEAAVTEMRVLVEGAISLFDEAWPSFSPAHTREQRQAVQCLDAVGMALGDLRDQLLGMQEGFLDLSERRAP